MIKLKLILVGCISLIAASSLLAQNTNEKKSKVKYIEVSIIVFPAAAIDLRKINKSRTMTWHSDTVKNEYYDEYVALKRAVEQPNTLNMINTFSDLGWELKTSHTQPVLNFVNTIAAIYYFRKEY